MNFRARRVVVNFARPDNVTAYGAGDVVGFIPGSPLEFDDLFPALGGLFKIMSAKLLIRKPGGVPAGMGAFRLHLYSEEPISPDDNAVYTLDNDDINSYMGFVTIPLPVDVGNSDWSQVDGVNFTGKLSVSSRKIYGILETVAAWTPLAELPLIVTLTVVPA